MIYSISDLHLDYTGKKSMEIFGNSWINYERKILDNWKEIINEDDLILVAGDISWAMTIEEAIIDLKRIEALPGFKVFIKGNHDYWWSSLKKLEDLQLSNCFFLQNNHYSHKDINIVGSRGWEDASKDSNIKVFKRELLRLEMSINSCDNTSSKIAMLHYPPFTKDGKPNEFHNILKNYKINICVYGHLHGPGLSNVIEGEIDGIKYFCTSSDYINFSPKFII